jgi:hypothetical protein
MEVVYVLQRIHTACLAGDLRDLKVEQAGLVGDLRDLKVEQAGLVGDLREYSELVKTGTKPIPLQAIAPAQVVEQANDAAAAADCEGPAQPAPVVAANLPAAAIIQDGGSTHAATLGSGTTGGVEEATESPSLLSPEELSAEKAHATTLESGLVPANVTYVAHPDDPPIQRSRRSQRANRM